MELNIENIIFMRFSRGLQGIIDSSWALSKEIELYGSVEGLDKPYLDNGSN